MQRRLAGVIALCAPLGAACMSMLGVDFDPSDAPRAAGPEAGMGAAAEGTDPVAPEPMAPDGARADAASDASAERPMGTVTVDTLVSGRDHIGARSTAGLRAWHGGLYATASDVYWVESGAAAGLYSAPASAPCATCTKKLATLTRASAFSATGDALLVADVNRIVRFRFPIMSGTAPEAVASATSEVGCLTASASAVFWSEKETPAIHRTAGGATSTPTFSNGDPAFMAWAGDQVFWFGVGMTGEEGLLQSVGLDGKNAAGVANIARGFYALAGNATYLYYATDKPVRLLRKTVASGRVETIAPGALGPSDMTLTATHAYWVEPGDAPDYQNGRLRRVAHDATSAETIAVSIAMPVAVAVAGDRIYVASAGTRAASYADGSILRFQFTE